MKDWETINTAPRDGSLVFITDHVNGEHLMAWHKGREQWEGRQFEVFGPTGIYWDESVSPVTHWRPNE